MNAVIAQQRLYNQRLLSTDFTRPQDVVAWLGAVQAQDYPGAKWALSQRMRFATNDSIEQAFAEGMILRTHLMRPTWHFVTPADIRWLLKLTAPRVRTIMSYYDRKLELDEAIFKRSNQTLTSALKGGVHLTRDELRKAIQGAGIVTKGSNRLAHILMRAELDGLICSGPRKGKQFTYALLEERFGKSLPVPDYDEYSISYKDRSAILNPGYSDEAKPVNTTFTSPILIGARVVGGWTRTFKKDAVLVDLHPYATFSKAEIKP